MDRKGLKLPFSSKTLTKYPCPSCGTGRLKVKEGTFHEKETVSSAGAHGHPDWYPDWIEYVYSCLFECVSCKDVVSSSGTGGVEEEYFYDHEGMPDRDFQDYYIPRYFHPPLQIFQCPKETPSNVIDELDKSFMLLFSDPPSSANHVRVALEHLLTELKVKRYSTNNGKRHFISLHKRIDLIPNKYEHVKDIFLAIKWLGNAGSHSNHEVTMDDVFDSYELVIELLDEIYSRKRSKAKTLAKKINKKKGPK